MVPRKQKTSKLVYQHLLWCPEYKLACHYNSSTQHMVEKIGLVIMSDVRSVSKDCLEATCWSILSPCV